MHYTLAAKLPIMVVCFFHRFMIDGLFSEDIYPVAALQCNIS